MFGVGCKDAPRLLSPAVLTGPAFRSCLLRLTDTRMLEARSG
jgi:hypothetical protein